MQTKRNETHGINHCWKQTAKPHGRELEEGERNSSLMSSNLGRAMQRREGKPNRKRHRAKESEHWMQVIHDRRTYSLKRIACILRCGTDAVPQLNSLAFFILEPKRFPSFKSRTQNGVEETLEQEFNSCCSRSLITILCVAHTHELLC